MVSRDFFAVIKDIVGVVPESEVGLRRQLVNCYDSACYTPPEGMLIRWYQLAGILDDALGDAEDKDLPAWAVTVRKIVTARGTSFEATPEQVAEYERRREAQR